MNPHRILVAIANYGTGNRQYLNRVLREYRSMPWQVDIVVLSNIPKDLGPGVEVVVGLPSRDPWSLPFAHKKVFAERADQYDHFIYAEDDILITRRNVEAFLEASQELFSDELAGFLRTEQRPDGELSFPDVHMSFRWDPRPAQRGPYCCAYFSNEHAGVYMLTADQLRRVIASGGYLVEPHFGRYGLPESAATDPYTRCGFRKLICISHLEDFCVPHLPNKYVGQMGVEAKVIRQQVAKLMERELPMRRQPWLTLETRMQKRRWSHDCYRPAKPEVLEALPKDAKCVLSIGCDLGATERELVRRGVHVVGIPTDPVIAASASASGIEILDAGLDEALALVGNRRFDAVLCLDVLHLVPDPVDVCRRARALLRDGGVLVVSAPHTGHAGTRVRQLLGYPEYRDVGNYARGGVQWVTERVIRRMFNRSGLRVGRVNRYVSDRFRRLNRVTGGVGEKLIAAEFLISGTAEA